MMLVAIWCLAPVALALLPTQFPLTPPTSDTCLQVPYTPPPPEAGYFASPEFRNLSIHRLTHAVQHATVMYDDMGPPGEDSRWKPFARFHDYLRETYPLVFSRAQVETVNGYSLLVTLPGSTGTMPVMLTGHQDVVVASSALDQWVHPPFEGHFDGEWVWGRGSSDCKSNVIGLLSVLERLLETSFKPRRTIVLAFGQDEEASGKYGAGEMGRVLEKRYGRGGLEMVLDEGGNGLDDTYGPLMALPALAEKGYADVLIEVRSPGGHSSVPPAHTTVGLLSRLIVALEDEDVYSPVLTKQSPIYRYLECVAAHGGQDKVPAWLPPALERGDMDELAHEYAERSLSQRYMIQTSKAATVFHGGVKSNALPEEAQAVINSRIQIGSTVDEHLDVVLGVIRPVAKKLNLALTAYGRPIHNGTRGSVALSVRDSSDPSPITEASGTAWRALSSAVRSTFGPHTIISPSLATSNTDTRHYWNLTQSIYRWTPARIGTRLNAHTVNERIKIDTHVEAVQLYYALIREMDRS